MSDFSRAPALSAADVLRDASLTISRVDAEWIVAHVLGLTRSELATARETCVTPTLLRRVEELAADHARLVRARAAQLTEVCRATVPRPRVRA